MFDSTDTVVVSETPTLSDAMLCDSRVTPTVADEMSAAFGWDRAPDADELACMEAEWLADQAQAELAMRAAERNVA